MGRQINFFMSEIDQSNFVNHIFSIGDQIFDVHGKPYFTNDELKNIEYKIFILFSGSPILSITDDFINNGESNVIEFLKCEFLEKENAFKEGRLYIKTEFLSNMVFVRKSDEFINWYELYKKYIRKNYKISKIDNRYIGPDAYQGYLDGRYRFITNTFSIVDF